MRCRGEDAIGYQVHPSGDRVLLGYGFTGPRPLEYTRGPDGSWERRTVDALPASNAWYEGGYLTIGSIFATMEGARRRWRGRWSGDYCPGSRGCSAIAVWLPSAMTTGLSRYRTLPELELIAELDELVQVTDKNAVGARLSGLSATAYSADLRRVTAVTNTGIVMSWNAETWAPVGEAVDWGGEIEELAYSPFGKIAVTSGQLWCRHRARCGHPGGPG